MGFYGFPEKKGPNCLSNFTVSFFLPLSYQGGSLDAVPTPSDSSVFLRTQPPLKVAVRSFPGFCHDGDVVSNVAALGADLMKANYSFENSTYVTAGYDSPFRIFNRHNEVWLVLAQQK